METQGRETIEKPQMMSPQMEIPPMDIPPIPITEEDNQRNKNKIKKMKKKVKELKVFDRLLKSQNEIVVETNQTLVLENEMLKQEHDKLKEEHELVCYQAFKWNKERKSLNKANKKFQVSLQIQSHQRAWSMQRRFNSIDILLIAAAMKTH